MACVRAMIIGQTVSVTRVPAWKLTDEFTHIASNTWSPHLHFYEYFFHLFPVVVVVLGHGSCLYGWPRLLPWKVHVMHLMWVFICLKNRLSLSLSESLSVSPRQKENVREPRFCLPATTRRRTSRLTIVASNSDEQEEAYSHTHTQPPDGDGIGWCVVLQMTALGWWINV
jgi:hypothetical protein